MAQQVFSFAAPVAPVNGRKPVARHGEAPFQAGSHASYTGAVAQAHVWTQKQAALLHALEGSPTSRQELAERLRWPISSVCSVLWSVRKQLDSVGFETAEWSGGRVTRRERFAIRR